MKKAALVETLHKISEELFWLPAINHAYDADIHEVRGEANEVMGRICIHICDALGDKARVIDPRTEEE